jgi:hypothetical protein
VHALPSTRFIIAVSDDHDRQGLSFGAFLNCRLFGIFELRRESAGKRRRERQVVQGGLSSEWDDCDFHGL